jgi:TolA-binding protein
MDSIIRKVSVGIQIHDPRIKWSNDMYLLLGQAFYYKGNYDNAATAFRYIIASDQKSKNKKGKSANSYTKSKGAPSIVEKKKKSKLSFLHYFKFD